MPEPDRIIRLRTVLHRTGLSRSTLYRKMLEGTFPHQLKIGIHSAGWHDPLSTSGLLTLRVGAHRMRDDGRRTY